MLGGDSLAQSGFSGRMVDMQCVPSLSHFSKVFEPKSDAFLLTSVALQRENAWHPGLQQSAMDKVGSQRDWRQSTTLEPERSAREVPVEDKPNKKRG